MIGIFLTVVQNAQSVPNNQTCLYRPSISQMLYEFHLAKGQWPAAASIAYSLARAFQAEKHLDANAYQSSAIYASLAQKLMSQLPKAAEGVRVAHVGGDSLIPGHILDAEAETLRARVLLLSLNVMEAETVPAIELFDLLLQKGKSLRVERAIIHCTNFRKFREDG